MHARCSRHGIIYPLATRAKFSFYRGMHFDMESAKARKHPSQLPTSLIMMIGDGQRQSLAGAEPGVIPYHVAQTTFAGPGHLICMSES